MTVEPTPEPTPADPEAAKWADLAKELDGDDVDGGEPEPQPDPQPEPEPEKAEDEPQEPRHVSAEEHENIKKALQEERQMRRQATEQLQSITQLIQQMRESRQQPKQEADEPKPPSLEEDPIGYFKWENEQLRKQVEEIKTGSTKSVEQVQAQLEEQRFWDTVIRSEQEIRTTAPDYDDATTFLENSRVAELEYMVPDDQHGQALAQQYGYQTPAQLRAAMLNQDRIAVAKQAMQLGKSPAQFYYELAKRRGYTPKAANGAGNGAGQQAGKTTGQQMIEAARRGQKAAKTLSGGTNGSGPDKPLNINDLVDLYDEDPEEADKIFDKMAKQGLLG